MGNGTSLESKKQDKIRGDVSNLKDLKCICDDAIERVLTQEPVKASADDASVRAGKQKESSTQEFVPFVASHAIEDATLLFSLIAPVAVISSFAYCYLRKVPWNDARPIYAVSVAIYIVANVIQACASYIIGPLVFTGTRKMFSNRIETERLKVLSCPLPQPTTSDKKADDGRPILVPPAYSVNVQYARSSNGGKSILARKADKLVLGNLGEWFTEDGVFVEAVFRQRLLSSLQKLCGE